MKLLIKKEVFKLIPKRKSDVHKGDCGRVVIIGGSKDMSGAVILTANSAYRSGAGLVYVICPDCISQIVHGASIESIVRGVYFESKYGTLNEACLKQADDIISKADVLVIGPGMGQNQHTKKLLIKLLNNKYNNKNLNVIIDADGINVLDRNSIKKQKLTSNNLILTPHPGELARLIKTDISSIQQKRIEIAEKTSKELNSIIILKGSGTVIACPKEITFVNTTGNSGMATAGSGDVLTGIIAGLLGQKMDEYNAVKLGVFIHGLAGDLAKNEKGTLGLIASDIAMKIPEAILKLEENN